MLEGSRCLGKQVGIPKLHCNPIASKNGVSMEVFPFILTIFKRERM